MTVLPKAQDWAGSRPRAFDHIPMPDPFRTSAALALATVVVAAPWLAGPAAGQVTTTTTTTSTTTSTVVPQALRCKNRLLGRATKLVRKRSRCDIRLRRRSAKGKLFDHVACADKATRRYDDSTASSRFTEAKGCLPCTLGAVDTIREQVLALADDLDTRIGCTPGTPIADRLNCETKLLKAAAAYQAALIRCRKEAALVVFEGGTSIEAQCRETARERYDKKTKRLTCPECLDVSGVADVARETVDDATLLAHCPCYNADPDACGECQACDVDEGCVAANANQPCGRNGCMPERCQGGACVAGAPITCTDGDVCTIDVCDDSDGQCTGEGCCAHDPLCDPATLGDCVIECACDPAVGCSCRCEPGCAVPACVIFTEP